MKDMLLFKPFRLKGLELKNRLVMFPMGNQYPDNKGRVTQRLIDYIARRAEGGVGMVMIQNTFVEPAGKSRSRHLGFDNDDQIPAFRKLAEVVHGYGAKIMIQTGHAGRESSEKVAGVPPVAPSAVVGPMKRMADGSTDAKPTVLTLEGIDALVKRHGEFARRAKEAGFDGAELLCGHRLLFEQFLFKDSNKRDDIYGGSIENRARLMCDVVRSFRQYTDKDFVISCRVPATESQEGGYLKEDIKKVFQLLEEAGADMFSITVATTRQWLNLLPMSYPRGALVPFSQEVKQFTHVPILCGVRINDPLLAEKVLEENKADLIGMGRPLLCDPDLPRKAMEGRFEDIRMCLACNKCIQMNYADIPISCAQNVELGREKELQIKPASQRKKVLVIGGGPAGMEAARVAALRGHDVSLYEKTNELGGQLRLAVLPPHKEELANVVKYLKPQMKKLGVKVKLGEELDAKSVQKLAPDVVIVAVGAAPAVPNIPGVTGTNVSLANDVLLGKAIGQKVIVIGGGQAGAETAEFLVDKGKEVTIIEMLDKIGQDLEAISRMFLRHRLAEKGVKVLTETKVVGIKPGGVLVQKAGKEDFIPAYSVVLAVGVKSNKELAASLKGNFAVHVVGDCAEPHGIMEAIHGAALLARQI